MIIMIHINDIQFSAFEESRVRSPKAKHGRKRPRRVKRNSGGDATDRLTTYDKLNIPLRYISNAHQVSREARSWITLGRVARGGSRRLSSANNNYFASL